MIVLEDNFNSKLNYKTYIALGSFDGLHIGHMGLINKTLQLSKSSNVKSMIYTFKNHPLTVINKDKVPKLLMDNETKIKLLDSLGVDTVNFVNFNSDYMKISPEDFIVNMVEYYNLQGLIVGFNYRFGYKNAGDIELLKKYSEKLGFELHVIDSVTYKDEIVSSSRIRNLIASGRVHEANEMLISPYMLSGRVVRGKQLGRTIGFPTVNLEYDKNFQLPGTGVYYTAVRYENKLYKGITSVGFNPTVEPSNEKISIETYILNFDKEIYDDNIKVYFIHKIREEIEFSSLELLVEQLKLDKAYAEGRNLEVFS
jgi:riboflavin kinase / FMN adenylyltransferase